MKALDDLTPEDIVSQSMKLLAFKDDKSDSYGPPFTVETIGMFIRTLQEELQRGQAIWAKHPQDFAIYELGYYHPGSGSVLLHDQKKCLGLVQDYKTSLDVAKQ